MGDVTYLYIAMLLFLNEEMCIKGKLLPYFDLAAEVAVCMWRGGTSG